MSPERGMFLQCSFKRVMMKQWICPRHPGTPAPGVQPLPERVGRCGRNVVHPDSAGFRGLGHGAHPRCCSGDLEELANACFHLKRASFLGGMAEPQGAMEEPWCSVLSNVKAFEPRAVFQSCPSPLACVIEESSLVVVVIVLFLVVSSTFFFNLLVSQSLVQYEKS